MYDNQIQELKTTEREHARLQYNRREIIILRKVQENKVQHEQLDKDNRYCLTGICSRKLLLNSVSAAKTHLWYTQ